jgi:hypothetical protein
VSWLAVAPSPFRGWIRWRPRNWPAAPSPYFDLATRRIVWPDESAPAAAPLPNDLPRRPGLVWLPPLAAARRAELDALRSRLADAGCTVVELALAEGASDGAGRTVWIEPLAAWLAGRDPRTWAREAGRAAAGAEIGVAVPLVAGITPEGEALDAWLEATRALTPFAVVGVSAELSPFDRRRLVESLGEEAFEAVFHGRPQRESEFARRVAAHALRTLPRRLMLASLTPRSTRNLELAGALWEAAELALRLGESEAECAALFAAARRLEASSLDIAALAREGNLGVFEWPSPTTRELVEELAARGRAERLDQLRRAWARGEPA